MTAFKGPGHRSGEMPGDRGDGLRLLRDGVLPAAARRGGLPAHGRVGREPGLKAQTAALRKRYDDIF